MTITLTINNPHYVDILTEMAKIVSLHPEVLCLSLIQRQMDEYKCDKELWLYNKVRSQMAEDVPFE